MKLTQVLAKYPQHQSVLKNKPASVRLSGIGVSKPRQITRRTALVPVTNTAQPTTTTTTTTNQKYVLEDAARFIKQEHEVIFSSGGITKERYSDDVIFQDPVLRIEGKENYQRMLSVFMTFFRNEYKLLSVQPSGEDQVIGRFSAVFELWALPWRPQLRLTGTSTFTIDVQTGKILKHQDRWDSVDNNNYISVEALAEVLRPYLSIQLTPNLESPKYLLLKKLKEYEIRSYQPFLIAETSMSENSSPAGGSGFNELVTYISGSNDRNASMSMTTPVITTGGKMYGGRNRMRFVMEKKYGNDVQVLPQPKDQNVMTKLDEGGIFGVTTFSGWPLDFEVVQAEQKLRGLLNGAGYTCGEGYELARYNEPTVPPFLRRNEILIEIMNVQQQDFYQ
eukprot:TRINITY_DN1609_c0_g1_i1.p1 TRINITY_DN1609_c0_g1~~TRINITY_DN1609_c0_g1_i1.p1  ORF type:complete len:420 (-),score=35.95 TRINITY_DN1609_c0_g1_i1:200-1375(-)